MYFVHTRDGLHIGYEPIEQINEDNKKGVRYWLGAYTCHENEVFATPQELKEAVEATVEKALNKFLQLEPFA